MKIENKTVVGATADKKQVTLYFDDGETMILPSDAEFTKKVIDKITPALAKGNKITLNMEEKVIDIFTELQEKSKGFVKFFRVAKKALGLGGDTPTLQHIESISLPLDQYSLTNEEETIVAVVEPEKPVIPVMDAVVNEADTISQEDLEAAADKYDELVREAKAEPTILVGAEKLKNQIKHFSQSDNPEGFKRFMERLSSVIKDRKHTADELLDFLHYADLPIADDGAIVAYKRLRRHQDNFVDSHTGKVTQNVGWRVFMKTEMVDPDRRRECSNGLHIGRRDYMGSFSGDAIVIVKVYPEDVVAVPQDYRGAKMRCSGYNIVGMINAAGMKLLCENKPMTDDPETAKLLTDILRGEHPPITNMVEITGPFGSNLVFSEVSSKAATPKAKPVKAPKKPTKAIEEVKEIKEIKKVNPEVNSPKTIKEKVKKAAPKNKGPVMTDEQKKAKKLWSKVKSGEMTKTALARECKTSTRSLERWAEKFNF